MIKRIIAVLLLIFIFSVNISAEEADPYSEIYEQSGAGELQNALPEDTREQFSQNGIDPANPEWASNISAKNVFTHIFEFFKSGMKSPLRSCAAVVGIILLCAALPILSPDISNLQITDSIIGLTAAATVAIPVWECVSSATNAIKASATFMLSFVPVFAVTVTAAGGVVTGTAMSALLLGAAQAVSFVSAFYVLPLMGGYFSIGLCSAVSPLSLNALAEVFKKFAFWCLSLVSTVFVGILGIQTAINSSADSVALRTARFILGTTVPIAGAALSEAASTLSASMGLLRSSVGIYGVVAVSAILLPLVIELLLWRMGLMISSAIAEIMKQSASVKIFKSIDMVLSVLIGIILLVGAMFIISLSVIITAGGKQ